MRHLLLVLVAAAAAAAAIAPAAPARAPRDLLKSPTRFAPLEPRTAYGASLFSPTVRITPPGAGWQGGQRVDHRYGWITLVYRADDAERGGALSIVAAPGSRQTAAATLQLLRTERAAGTNVGIDVTAVTPLSVGGFPGKQLEGTVIGQFGHTFVPFSGHSHGASGSAGDHYRVPHGVAFRIVVVDVRGHTVVAFEDSDRPQVNLDFSAEAAKMLSALRFPNG
jgi:hypothetical protein